MKKMLDATAFKKMILYENYENGFFGNERRRRDQILARGGARSAKPLEGFPKNIQAPEGRQKRNHRLAPLQGAKL